MRRLLLLLALSIFPFTAYMQVSSGDCEGATILCGDLYTEEQAPPGTGNIYEFTGSCNQNLETMSLWYVFNVWETGDLSFVLTPNNSQDDYDWGLFNITNGGCAGIGSNSPEVSCNSYGVFGSNGPTGISTANGGVSNSSGPGNFNGPPFNSNLPVSVGQTFALVVMNWSNSQDGYTIDFGESTADLYEQIPPTPINLTASCTNVELLVTFSENVIVATADDLDFVLTGPQGDFSIVSVTPYNPQAYFENEFYLVLNQQIQEPGVYTLSITNESGSVEDPCGNEAVGQITIDIPEPILFETTITTACNGSGGAIEVGSITGGEGNYEMLLNNVAQNGTSIANLPGGNYSITIRDDNDCTTTEQITVPDHILNVTVPIQDTLSCSVPNVNIEGLTITPQQEVTYSWSFLTLDGFVENGDMNASPTYSTAGIYQVTVTDVVDGCTSTTTVAIEEDDSNNLAILTEVFPACNGSGGSIVIITVSGGLEPYDFYVDDQLQDGLIADGLDDGTHSITLIDANGCNLSQLSEVLDHSLSVTIPAQDVLTCGSPSVQITGLVIEPGQNADFEWAHDDGNGFEDIDEQTASPVVEYAGTYQVTVTNPQNGCSAIATIEINSTIADDLDFIALVTDACNGMNGAIEIISTSGGEGPYTFSLEGIEQSSFLADGLDDGSYTATITDNNDCSFSEDVLVPDHFIIVDIPQPGMLACNIGEVQVSGVNISPGQTVTYQWAFYTSNGYVPAGDGSATPWFTQPGIYQLTVTNEDSGCTGLAAIEIEYSNENDLDVVSSIHTACNGVNGSVEITEVTNGTGPFEFLLNGNEQDDLLANGLVDGTYSVTITDANDCVVNTQITIPDHSIGVTIGEQDVLSCRTPRVDIEGIEVSPEQEVNYEWFQFENNQFNEVGANTAEQSFYSTGVYQLTVSNVDNGCSASVNFELYSGTVTAVDFSDLVFPNIITPNGDSKNESWAPFLAHNPTLEITEIFDTYELQVFNRWGKKLFDSKEDGIWKWSTKDADTGTYYYLVSYRSSCGGVQEDAKQGTFELIK